MRRNKKKNRTPPQPTVDQTARLGDLEALSAALSAEHGAPNTEGVTEQVGATLEESLKRVEGLLNDARAHLNRAREKESAAKAEGERLATQRRDQEEAQKRRKREVDGEIAAARKEAEVAIKERQDLIEIEELELEERVRACETREAAVATREAESSAKEAALLDQAAQLAEREINAEQGFVAEKARVLGPLEEELTQLREQRDQLADEIASRREQAEEEARSKAAERAKKWAQQDAERTSQEGKDRRAFDEKMARERQAALEQLREELRVAREQAEADWQRDLDARSARLDDRQAELDTLHGELLEKAKSQRSAERDLQAAQEMLAEDRAALDRKVERLAAERTEDLRHEVASLRQQLEDARTTRDGYFDEIESRRELDRRFGDRTPDQILADLTALERERDDLARQLRERPDAGAAERLAALERERSEWLEKSAVLQGDLAKAQGELASRRLAAIELEALRKQKEALEIHKQLLDGAVDELRSRVVELTRQEDHRNPMTALTSLDENEAFQAEARTTAPLRKATPTLREFAEDLRHRIATGMKGRTLYYAERNVRAFLGGLAMTRLLLLQGISGTGKTSLPCALASAVGGDFEIVEIQAGWRDRQDLVGYYNAFHRHYYASDFLKALYRAGTPAYKDRVFMMVLDEINLSRPEQYFADFLSKLEQPLCDRRLSLVNDPVSDAPRLMVDEKGGRTNNRATHLPIPPNVWFVGTANHDETKFEFADFTYDRAHVMEMPRVTDEAHFDVKPRGARNSISFEKLEAAFDDAVVSQAKAVQKATTWLRKAPFVGVLGSKFRVGWGNRLENQLTRYVPVVVEAGGSVGEAMDHLLATKVLRKLKDRHDVRASALEELQDEILTAWDELDKPNPPERCLALIEHEITAKQGEELV